MILRTKTFRWLQAFTEVILRARREELHVMQGVAGVPSAPADAYQEISADDPGAMAALAAMGFPIEMPPE